MTHLQGSSQASRLWFPAAAVIEIPLLTARFRDSLMVGLFAMNVREMFTTDPRQLRGG